MKYNFCINDKDRDSISNTISFLRFPLALMVIVLHCGLADMNVSVLGLPDIRANYPIYYWVTWVFGHFISNCAVPCFFIISGFLLFYNVDKYNMSIYRKKVVSRLFTLLIPYIAWNTIYLILFYFIGRDRIVLSTVPNIFSSNVSLGNFLYVAYVRPPVDGPLWFVRNLFGMVLAAPLFYWIIKRTKFLMPLCLIVLSLFSLNSFLLSVMWFSIGIACSVHKIDLFRCCGKLLPCTFTICILALLFDITFSSQIGKHIVDYLYVLRVMSVMGAGYLLVNKYHLTFSKTLQKSTFVIYAYHSIPSQLLIVSLLSILGCSNLSLFLVYVISILVLIMGGYFLYIIIHKIPVVSRIFTGH